MQSNSNPSAGLSLRALFPAAQFWGAQDVLVRYCSSDSRACQPGDLFVATIGSRHDGHDFVADALRRGATAVLAERPLPACPVPVCVVDDTRAALGAVCQALADFPSRSLKVVGVTGSYGKTCTAALIAGVLAAGGYRSGVLCDLGYFDSHNWEPALEGELPAPALAYWLSRMAAHDCTHAVLEVSSRALAQSRLAGIELDAACVTNVLREHLDYHGTLSNYRRVKSRILERLRPEAVAVLNADDPVARGFQSLTDGPTLAVSMIGTTELVGVVVERSLSEQTFLLSSGSESAAVRTEMIGNHHVQNCLLAAGVGLIYGLDLTVVARGLEKAGRIPQRLERIECGQPFGVFVDNARTARALSTGLETLREVVPGRLICLTAADGESDRRERPRLGRAAERLADSVIVTSANSRGEDPEQIAGDLFAGMNDPLNAQWLPDRDQAIRHALATARSGDGVLIAGASGAERRPFDEADNFVDDAEVVRDYLYNQAPAASELRSAVGRARIVSWS